jgi:hypothetical protein
VLVGFPVLEVGVFVGDVEVTHNEEVAALGGAFLAASD